MGFIGKRVGSATSFGNEGGSFSLDDLYRLQSMQRIGNDPGAAANAIGASGGVISEYSSGPDIYRVHVFTNSGTFTLDKAASGDYENSAEVIVVAGGGGGGSTVDNGAGGGGGGGVVIATKYELGSDGQDYTVTVGAGGGVLVQGGSNSRGGLGGNSFFGPPSPGAAGPAPPNGLSALGGGGGGAQGGPGGGHNGHPGGSGGGATFPGGEGGHASQPGVTQGGITSPFYTNYGNDAGDAYPGSPYSQGTGGGGAGSASAGISTSAGWYASQGGDGVDNLYQTNSNRGYAAGGGAYGYSVQSIGGGTGNATKSSGDSGNSPPTDYSQGKAASGGGGAGNGAGGPAPMPTQVGGAGGSGIVAIRYKIANLSGTAKASGGAISYYNSKVIHTFLYSGTFVCPGSFSETCEYAVIGGGGGSCAGGGGAGGLMVGSMPISGPQTVTMTVGAGGNGTRWDVESNVTQGVASSINQPAAPDVSAPGGGKGGWGGPQGAPALNGGAGGSGGGASSYSGGQGSAGTGYGDPFPGTYGDAPVNGWGNDGGAASSSAPNYGLGGGGGAGTVGEAGTGSEAGNGGQGMQLPSTFRDPTSEFTGGTGPTSPPWTPTGGDDSGKFWVGGGGGAGEVQGVNTWGTGGGAPDPAVRYAGGGAGNRSPLGVPGMHGQSGTGGGGAGSRWPSSDHTAGGNGGSGFVLIAYPS